MSAIEVSVARSGEEGFYLLYSERFDLLMLDVMCPAETDLRFLRNSARMESLFPCFC